MSLVSVMGYNYFLMTVAVSVIIGYDLRKGFALMHLILFTGLISEILKIIIAYPRPVDVDSSLIKIGIENKQGSYGFNKMGAKGFFESLSPEVVSFFRNLSGYGHGIPSGHVAVTTTIWGGFSIFSKKKVFYYLSAFMIVLMAVSRMYLGRHFLADVTAGFALGLFISAGFYYFTYQNGNFEKLLPRKTKVKLSIRTVLEYIYFFILPLATIFVPYAGIPLAASIIAVNFAYIFSARQGIREFSGKILNGALRILLAFGFYYLIKLILNFLFPWNEAIFLFLKSFLPVFSMIILTVKMSGKYRILS